MSNPRSATTTGIVVTFSDRLYDLLTHYEVDGFRSDYPTEEARAKACASSPGYFPGKVALVEAFEKATRTGRGWSMVVSADALDFLLHPVGFCENALDIFSCGGGSGDPADTRAVRAFYARMKALRAAQQSA